MTTLLLKTLKCSCEMYNSGQSQCTAFFIWRKI